MNTYELTVTLRNKDVDGAREKMKEILQKHNVNIVKEDPWGTRRLAYEIDNEREGYYYFAIVEASPEVIDKIAGDFKLVQDILRHLFVKIKLEQSA